MRLWGWWKKAGVETMGCRWEPVRVELVNVGFLWTVLSSCCSRHDLVVTAGGGNVAEAERLLRLLRQEHEARAAYESVMGTSAGAPGDAAAPR